jgi:hypothetical protein
MSEKRSKVPTPYLSDEEFLKGFHRTREGLHTFDAVDLDELTKQGFEAYWQTRQAQAPVVIDEPAAEAATVQLARSYAQGSGLAVSLGGFAIGAALMAVSWWREPLWRFVRSLRHSAEGEAEVPVSPVDTPAELAYRMNAPEEATRSVTRLVL